MTLTTEELRRARAVAELVIEWRKWRRSMHLTIPEAAAMAGTHPHYLQQLELGRMRAGRKTRAKLEALMARWNEDMRPKKAAERRGGRRVATQR